jgi:hypothetical protein
MTPDAPRDKDRGKSGTRQLDLFGSRGDDEKYDNVENVSGEIER